MLRLAALLLLATPVLAQDAPRVQVGVKGNLQVDYRLFAEGPEGEAPGFLVRRARAEATVEFDGRLRVVGEADVGEGTAELLDGYAEADLGRGLHVRAGRFKTPFGLESLRSSKNLRFAERSLATALSPRRDVGAMVWGAWGRAEAQAGIFNGVPDGASRQLASDGSPDVAARVFGFPIRRDGLSLGVGVAVAAGREAGTPDAPALADYETSGDRAFFSYADGVVADGMRLRVGPQATLDVGRLSLLGEWTRARHRVATPDGPGTFSAHAWQVAASAVLIGDPQGDGRPMPRRSIVEGGPGAVEVSVRLHGLRLEDAATRLAAPEAAQRATAAGIALQWSPTEEARIGVTAERTLLGGFAGVEGGPPETFIVVRAQVAF